jgi:MFS family permease
VAIGQRSTAPGGDRTHRHHRHHSRVTGTPRTQVLNVNNRSAAGTDRPAAGRRQAFASAVVSLTAAFAASASPIPLFNTYRAEQGFTNADISLAVVSYFVGTITALLVLGRLSGHLGRRPTSLATLALLAAGCVLLLNVHGLGWLIGGRLLMGLGAGLASSALTSYIVDAAPSAPSWVASVASSQAPMLGLTLGAVGSGALVQYGPWPRTLVYLIMIAALLASASLIVASPETAPRTLGAWRSLRPRVHLPRRVRHLLPVAASILLATWATGAFYQAFVPALTQEQLGTQNALVIGLVFSAYMAPSVIGAPIGGRFAPATAQRLGMVAFLIGMVAILTALSLSTLPLFVAGSLIAGGGQGIAVSSTIRGLLHRSTIADRSPIFAAIYLLSYTGAAVPSLIAGQLSHTLTMTEIALGYGGLALAATLITVIAARNP